MIIPTEKSTLNTNLASCFALIFFLSSFESVLYPAIVLGNVKIIILNTIKNVPIIKLDVDIQIIIDNVDLIGKYTKFWCCFTINRMFRLCYY